MSEISARMDENEPEYSATLNRTDSSAVLVLHDHAAHPENLVLFKQLILKVLKKGYIFGLPK